MQQRRAVVRFLDHRRAARPRRTRSCRRRARAWRCAGTPATRAGPRACAASRRCSHRRAALRAAPGMTLVSLNTSTSPGPKQVRQVEHLPVGDLASLDQQQPRAIARPRRPQRDPLRRKLEIEKVDAHRAAIAFWPRRSRPHEYALTILVGSRRRLARRDRVDRVHARHHPAQDRVVVVEARRWART